MARGTAGDPRFGPSRGHRAYGSGGALSWGGGGGGEPGAPPRWRGDAAALSLSFATETAEPGTALSL